MWVAALDGTGAVRLTEGVDPAISPDGTRVAYTLDTSPAGGVRRHIAVVDVATRASRVLAAVPGDNAFGPVWSPDGSSLLVNVLSGKRWTVGLVKADGSGYRTLVSPSAERDSCWGAVFAPDGRSIFCQNLDTVVRRSLDGTLLWSAQVTQLFPTGGLNSGARLVPSPDGRQLLIDVDMDEDTTMKDWDGPPPAVFVVDLEAKSARRLTPRGTFAWDPCWLDASAFLCIRMREGEREPSVVRMPFTGGPAVLVVTDARTPSVSARDR